MGKGLIFTRLTELGRGGRDALPSSVGSPRASVTLGVGSIALKANPVPPIFARLR